MNNYDRIRILICDHLNLARGKYVPADHSSSSIQLCLGLYALGYNREMVSAPGAGMLDGFPDMSATFDKEDVRPGWEDGVAVVVADLYSENDTLPLCPRSTLKHAVEEWYKQGYGVKIGIELEAYLFQHSESDDWVPYEIPGAYVYGTGPTADPDGIIEKIWQQSKISGFQLEAIHSEYDSAQFEFSLRKNDTLEAIDEAFLFRLMAMEVCSKAGYKLSFMPKPVNDRCGSGFHINFSLFSNESNNAFDDDKKEDGLSELTKNCIAGLLKHHQALAGLQAPIINSYRRLRPACLNGYWANWGYDHRGTAVRIPKERGENTRIEHRLADGASNPYIATAATLYAALLGHLNKYDLQKAETGDCLETCDTNLCVADTLGESLDALAADTAFCEAVGDPIIQHHLGIKRQEWLRYLSHTSDWEKNEYFNFL